MRVDLLGTRTATFFFGLTVTWKRGARRDPPLDEPATEEPDADFEDPSGLGSPGFNIFALFMVLRST
jgi:hypothetical protein